jgi:hypothetical protein
MKTIRNKTFETNSSSTHSLIIVTEEENEKLNQGIYFVKNMYDDTIIDQSDYEKIYQEAIADYNLENPDSTISTIEEFQETDDYLDNQSEFPKSLEDWCCDGDLSHDMYNYTSPSGDNLVIHVKYGYY